MRTVDFSTVMFRFMQLAGLDRNAITTETYQTFRDFLNFRLEQIWGENNWPDLIRVTDAPGVAVTTDANGVRTATLPADAEEIFNVYDKDPRLTTRAKGLRYFLYNDSTGNYINLMDDVASVYIEYRIRSPKLFGEPYAASTIYYPGSQVYFDTSTASGSFTPSATKTTSGNLYNCINQTTGTQNPSTNPTYWEIVEIPFFTQDFLARACHADFLRSEGQFDQALIAERDAANAIEREVDKVLREQGQVRRPNVFTY